MTNKKNELDLENKRMNLGNLIFSYTKQSMKWFLKNEDDLQNKNRENFYDELYKLYHRMPEILEELSELSKEQLDTLEKTYKTKMKTMKMNVDAINSNFDEKKFKSLIKESNQMLF